MTKHIHGGDVYKYDHCLDFSANCNPLGTPQSVKQAIIDSVEDLSDYPRRRSAGPLKEGNRRLRRWSVSWKRGPV